MSSDVNVQKVIGEYLKETLEHGDWNKEVFEVLEEQNINVKRKANNHKDELEDLVDSSDPKVKAFYILNPRLISENGVLAEAKSEMLRYFEKREILAFTQTSLGIVPLSSIPKKYLEPALKSAIEYVKGKENQSYLDQFLN
jgi:hypothetical protein